MPSNNADLDLNSHNLINSGMVPKRTAISDANHTLAASDVVIAYTSISAIRYVLVDPSAMTVNKIYEVRDESGQITDSSGNNTGKINVTRTNPPTTSDRIFNGRVGFYITQNYGSVRFYTPDNVHVYSLGPVNLYEYDARTDPIDFNGPCAGVQSVIDTGAALDLTSKFLDLLGCYVWCATPGVGWAVYLADGSFFTVPGVGGAAGIFDFGTMYAHNVQGLISADGSKLLMQVDTHDLKIPTVLASTVTHATVSPALTINQMTPIDTSGGTVSAQLPNPSGNSGLAVYVWDSTGNFDKNNLTVTQHSSEKIGGVAASYVCTSRNGVYAFISNGTDWLVPGGLNQSVNVQTGTTYTVAPKDAGNAVTLSNAGAITVTLDDDSHQAYPIGGETTFIVLGAGQATFVAGNTAVLHARGGLVASNGQYSVIWAKKYLASTWVLSGDRT
jgi:hypothetical protein